MELFIILLILILWVFILKLNKKWPKFITEWAWAICCLYHVVISSKFSLLIKLRTDFFLEYLIFLNCII